eukprot:1138304-Pelagomonas_calceolata.AAC.2
MRRAQRPLEMFFPFDPYLLKRSSGALGLSTSYISRTQPIVGVQVMSNPLQGTDVPDGCSFQTALHAWDVVHCVAAVSHVHSHAHDTFKGALLYILHALHGVKQPRSSASSGTPRRLMTG